MTHEHAQDPERTRSGSWDVPTWMAPLLSLTTWFGIVGFAVAEVVQLLQHGTSGFVDATFVNFLAWVVGANSLIVAGGHLFFPDPVARSIGWPTGSPFQWEVGLAGLLIGVLGVMAASFGRGFQLAAVIAFAIFYLGAAIGHIRERVVHGNRAAGNAGFIFWFDIVAPLAAIALYVATG